MTAEQLAQGLRAIDDPEVRAKVAAGDLSAAGDLDLSDEEAALLRGAADDYPDVAGFTVDAFLTVGPGPTGGNVSAGFPKYNEALSYLKDLWKGW